VSLISSALQDRLPPHQSSSLGPRTAALPTGLEPHPAPPKPIVSPAYQGRAEENTMSLQKDKVEWELPHFKEAHQMHVSDMGGLLSEGYPCVTSLFARWSANGACML
jgi:hypothetical protein